jgi:mono/diheme cytochrome c family protein
MAGYCSIENQVKKLLMRTMWRVVALLMLTAGTSFAQGAVERGQKVYAAEKCGVCHAVAGVGNKRGALDEIGSKLSADFVRQWIVDAPGMSAKTKATRKPVMKSYAHLAKEDVDGLVAYMQSLKK